MKKKKKNNTGEIRTQYKSQMMNIFIYNILFYFFFFFSSRRRHTRYWRDWSSDVCSSDLAQLRAPAHLERADHEPTPVRCRRDAVSRNLDPIAGQRNAGLDGDRKSVV